MKKQKFFIFLLVFILVLLTGSIYYLNSQSNPEADSGTTVLLQKSPDTVTSVSITNSSEAYTVYQSEKGLYIEGYEDLPLNQQALEDLFYYSSYIRSQAAVESPSKNLETYGLGTPSADVTVCFNDGQQVSFQIGSSVPGQSSAETMYLLYEDKIYIAYKLHLEPFLFAKTQYLEQEITPVSLSADDPNLSSETSLTVTSLNMQRQDLAFPIEVNYDTSENVMGYTMSQYSIAFSPDMTYTYSTDDIGAEFLSSFFNLSASDIYALRPSQDDLKSCGLDAPFLKADVAYKDGAEKAGSFSIIASQPSQGRFYIMNDSADIIYCSDSVESLFFTAEVSSLVSCYLLTPDISQLISVDIQKGNTAFTFTLTHDEEEISGISFNENPLSVDTFKSFYQNLISLKADSAYQDTVALQSLPLCSKIRYHFKNNTVEEINFYSLSEREVLVTINDMQTYIMNQTKLDNLWTQIEELSSLSN